MSGILTRVRLDRGLALQGHWTIPVFFVFFDLTVLAAFLVLAELASAIWAAVIPAEPVIHLFGEPLALVKGVTILSDTLFTLLALLIISLLAVGMRGWYATVPDGRELPVGFCFYAWTAGGFGRTLWLKLRVGFGMMVWAVVCFLPAVLCFWFSGFAQGLWEGNADLLLSSFPIAFAIVGLVLALVGFYLWVRRSTRYFLVDLLRMEDPDRTVSEVIRLSARYAVPHARLLAGYVCSQLGWLLLCVLLLPVFYVVPQFCQGRALLARYCLEAGRQLPTQADLLDQTDQTNSQDA